MEADYSSNSNSIDKVGTFYGLKKLATGIRDIAVQNVEKVTLVKKQEVMDSMSDQVYINLSVLFDKIWLAYGVTVALKPTDQAVLFC